MREDKKNLSSVFFFNRETGKEICSIETTPFTLMPNISADAELTYRIDGGLSFTLDDCESQKLWKDLIVNDPVNTTIEFDGYIPNGLVQARTHKKRRINKKWLRRHGMKLGYKKVHGKMLECKADSFPNYVDISCDHITLE